MAVDIKEMREREKKNVLNLRPDEIGIPRRVWRYVTLECGKNPRNGESATVAQLINYTASELMNANASIGTVAIQQTQDILSKYGLSLKTEQEVRKEYVQHLLDLPREDFLNLDVKELGITDSTRDAVKKYFLKIEEPCEVVTIDQFISFTENDFLNRFNVCKADVQRAKETLSEFGLSLKSVDRQKLLSLPREELLDLPIRDLGIPSRLCNVIEDIEPEAVVRGFTEMTEDDLLKLDKVGVDSVNEAKVILHSYGIYLAEERPMVEKWYSVQHTGTVKYNVMFGDKKVLDCYSEQCANSIVELLNEDLKSIQ